MRFQKDGVLRHKAVLTVLIVKKFSPDRVKPVEVADCVPA